jgi:hypothetical protein
MVGKDKKRLLLECDKLYVCKDEKSFWISEKMRLDFLSIEFTMHIKWLIITTLGCLQLEILWPA